MKEIKIELRKHFVDYLLLVVAGLFTVLCLTLFKGEQSTQFMFIIGYGVFYLLWAWLHHSLEKTLKVKNMLEYVLIALIIVISIRIIILQ